MIKEEQLLKNKNKIYKIISSSKYWGHHYPMRDFLIMMKFYGNPSMYGNRIQNRLIQDRGWKYVPSIKDRGDAKDLNKKYCELKVSYANSKNHYSVLQIRPHQNIDYYLFYFIDENINIREYHIPKEVITKFKLNNCHGIKNSIIDNENKEYRIDFKPNGSTKERVQWNLLNEYIINDNFNKKNKFW